MRFLLNKNSKSIINEQESDKVSVFSNIFSDEKCKMETIKIKCKVKTKKFRLKRTNTVKLCKCHSLCFIFVSFSMFVCILCRIVYNRQKNSSVIL